jgi:hypothetical protein
MTTFTATRAGSTQPVAGHGFSGNVKRAYGTISVTTNPLANDVYEICRVPKGAIVVGGEFFGAAIEAATTAARTLDMDVGIAANGVDSADPDAFGNFGSLSPYAVTGYKPEATGFRYPLGGLLLSAGPQTMGAETVVQVTCIASATTFTSGVIGVVVDYVLP